MFTERKMLEQKSFQNNLTFPEDANRHSAAKTEAYVAKEMLTDGILTCFDSA